MTATRLQAIYNVLAKSCDPERPFFYLGGPMTGIESFNFPRFREVASRLRRQGYNIASPAELDDPATEEAAMRSRDGAPGSGAANGESYGDFLARDLVITALPMCVGGIFLEGWHNSRGARGESWQLEFLNKQLFEYDEEDGTPALTVIKRDERLSELGIAPEGVPKDAPGCRTAEGYSGEPLGPPEWVTNAGAVEIQDALRARDASGPFFTGSRVGER